MALNEISWMIILTLLPFLELRASIPYGIATLGVKSWFLVFVVCSLTNILLAPALWVFVNKIMYLFLKIEWINNIYKKIVVKTQKKVQPYVEKYGTLGLAVFIGIPLPGSGVYSGALGAYLLGYNYKDYFKAAVYGVLLAGSIVLLISVFGKGIIVDLFLKAI